MTELRPNLNQATVTYGDRSQSEVLGFGKVVIAKGITLVNVMLVESLGFNLLSVRALNKMGFAVFLDIDVVVLLWSKTLKVAFVGYVEDDLFVVDFSGKTTTNSMCLFGKADKGWLWHRRLAHVNMRTLQSLHKGGHQGGVRVGGEGRRRQARRAPVPRRVVSHAHRVLQLLLQHQERRHELALRAGDRRRRRRQRARAWAEAHLEG